MPVHILARLQFAKKIEELRELLLGDAYSCVFHHEADHSDRVVWRLAVVSDT